MSADGEQGIAELRLADELLTDTFVEVNQMPWVKVTMAWRN